MSIKEKIKVNSKYGLFACLFLFGSVCVTLAYLGGVAQYNREASLGIDVGTMSMHVTVYLERSGEDPIYWDHHAGTLTTIGQNWIEDQLGDSPSTDPSKWISVSTDATSPTSAWTQIPSELAVSGFTRASGTYASTGDGVWTITYQFTATGTVNNIQLTGLQWAVSGDNNLLGADTFTPVTVNDGDKLTIEWEITVS